MTKKKIKPKDHFFFHFFQKQKKIFLFFFRSSSIGCLTQNMTKKTSTKKSFFSKSQFYFFKIFFWKIIKFFWKIIYFFTATAALYLGLSLIDAQRSHLGKRQFWTLISLLRLRTFKVKVAYYYHHNDHHQHCNHHHYHQNYQNTQNYQTCKKNRKNKNCQKSQNFEKTFLIFAKEYLVTSYYFCYTTGQHLVLVWVKVLNWLELEWVDIETTCAIS